MNTETENNIIKIILDIRNRNDGVLEEEVPEAQKIQKSNLVCALVPDSIFKIQPQTQIGFNSVLVTTERNYLYNF